MTNVYVVVENGDLYPVLYSSYEAARSAVTTKYADELRAEWEAGEELNDPDYKMVSEVDVDENKTGTTQLYIEKGINIIIQRYMTMTDSVVDALTKENAKLRENMVKQQREVNSYRIEMTKEMNELRSREPRFSAPLL
jgi:hypothetical protein